MFSDNYSTNIHGALMLHSHRKKVDNNYKKNFGKVK